MCGIIGVALSEGRAAPLIVEGLRRLEYRGYDSVGVATLDGGTVRVAKARGKLAEVEARLGLSLLPGRVGIGHTRWATHGEPSDENAHPLTDCSGRVAVVANGIVENHAELRRMLVEEGHLFTSSTDTEVIAHMVEDGLRGGLDGLEALRRAAQAARGSIAVAALVAGEERILFYRRGSPLIVGLSRGAGYLASDIPALLGLAEEIYVLQDGDSGSLGAGALEIYDGQGRRVDPAERRLRVDWGAESVSRMGYPHFMLKEVYEQPIALERTLRGLRGLRGAAESLLEARHIYLAAAGTSFHAALAFAYLLPRLAGLPAHPLVASEYGMALPAIGPGDLLVAVTQSGETADTLAAMRAFKASGARVLAVVNVPGSAAAREADIVLYTRAGPEIAVAATKTFTTQLLTLSALALEAAALTGSMSPGELREAWAWLRRAPRAAADALRLSEKWSRRLASTMARSRGAYYLGRGLGVPVAMEGALKLKEIAYVHAEAYPAGESKHGPIALVEEGFPVVLVCPEEELLDKALAGLEEMKARGAYTALLAPTRSAEADMLLHMPSLHPVMAAIAYAVPLQLAAYHASVARGLNPDRPRNLAKSVTVG